MSCEDQEPHPVGNEKVCFKVSWHETQCGDGYIDITHNYGEPNQEGYVCVDVDKNKEYTFNFLEESLHNLEWYCEDGLGNKGEVNIEYDNVDDHGPFIWIHNPSLLESLHVEDCSLDVLTEIKDLKSGIDESSIYVTITPEGGEEILFGDLEKVSSGHGAIFGGDGYEGVFDIQNYEAGIYTLRIYATDNLGNVNVETRVIKLASGVYVDRYDLPHCNVPSTGGTCDLTFHACIRGSTEINFYMGKIKDDLVSPLALNGTLWVDDRSGAVGVMNAYGGYDFLADKVKLTDDCSVVNGKKDFKVSLTFTEDMINKIGGGQYKFDWKVNSYLFDGLCSNPEE